MMKPAISILCPTRGRPALFQRMRESALATAGAGIEVLAMLDSDDATMPRYAQIAPTQTLLSGDFRSVGAMWNQLARECTGQVLMLANDDLVFQSKEWDEKIITEARAQWPDDIWLAWCNDGSGKSAQHAAFPLISRRWYETLGYFAPECFHFLYHDTWIFDIGKRAGRALYCPDIMIEHRHFAFKKAEYDATYRRHRVGAAKAKERREDERTFANGAAKRQADADLLLRAIAEEGLS